MHTHWTHRNLLLWNWTFLVHIFYVNDLVLNPRIIIVTPNFIMWHSNEKFNASHTKSELTLQRSRISKEIVKCFSNTIRIDVRSPAGPTHKRSAHHSPVPMWVPSHSHDVWCHCRVRWELRSCRTRAHTCHHNTQPLCGIKRKKEGLRRCESSGPDLKDLRDFEMDFWNYYDYYKKIN